MGESAQPLAGCLINDIAESGKITRIRPVSNISSWAWGEADKSWKGVVTRSADRTLTADVIYKEVKGSTPQQAQPAAARKGVAFILA